MMKKVMLGALVALTVSAGANAEPQWLTDFRNDGQAPYNLDFQMQPEADAMAETMKQQDRQLMSGISGAAALASVPEKEGRYVGMGVAKYRQAEAVALVGGFSKEKWSMKTGLSYDDSHHLTAVAGASYKW